MSWHAQLDIAYRLEQQRSVARHSHTGPLRVLQSLYPEGDAICHNVLVHPPGGLVGGDTLDMVDHRRGTAHGLITTPGATRFYRSLGEPAVQRTRHHRCKTRRDWNGCRWKPSPTTPAWQKTT